MKKYIINLIICLFIACTIFSNVVQAETPTEKGLNIAKEANRRDEGFGDVVSKMQMILMNKQGQKSTREIRIKTLEVIA